jgi:hypothetical protein
MKTSRIILITLFSIFLLASKSYSFDLVSTLNFPGGSQILNVTVIDDYAYFGLYYSGLAVVDVSDPLNPAFDGYMTLNAVYPLKVAASGTTLYVLAGNAGLYIVNADTPNAPYVVSARFVAYGLKDIAVSGDTLYILTHYSGLHVFDISDANNPVFTKVITLPEMSLNFAISDTHAYIATISGLTIVDLTTSTVVGTNYTPPFNFYKTITVSGNYLYLVSHAQGNFYVFDLTAPTTPVLLYNSQGDFVTSSTCRNIVISDDRAYLTCYHDIFVINVTDPYVPYIEDSYFNASDTPVDIDVPDRYSFIALYNSGLGVAEAIGESEIEVTIDIKPGSDPNSINLESGGALTVAVFSSIEPPVDATQIAPETVTLAGAPIRTVGVSQRYQYSYEDINGDGLIDFVAQIDKPQLQLTEVDTTAIFEAETFGGELLIGEDSINIVY